MNNSLDDFLAVTTPRVTRDVTISAVQYDALLVADVAARLTALIGAMPYWRGTASEGDAARATLAESTRLVVVLHQRLWSHDAATRADAIELQQVDARSRLPVFVISIDDEPIPTWLTHSSILAVHATSIDDLVEQVRELFANPLARRRDARRTDMIDDADPPRPARWGEGPQPYLDQPRSASALRHAFDEIEAELTRRVASEPGHSSERRAKLHSAPGRLVVQLAEVGLSFSWVPGRSGAVGDGRLLVIEWDGVVAHGRGMGAMRTASPGRERVFQAIATGPGDLRWRAADSGAGSYSSLDLAGQAFAGALLTLGGVRESRADQPS
jgi:hypothetical protein